MSWSNQVLGYTWDINVSIHQNRFCIILDFLVIEYQHNIKQFDLRLYVATCKFANDICRVHLERE